MARYEVQKDLTYYRNHSTQEQVVLKQGDVVQGVHLSSLDKPTAKLMQKAEKREQQVGNERLLYFKAYGVVRYAMAIRDLLPTRRAANIPTEQQ